jgi:putative hydrolase of the HAD superfamily
LAAVELEAAIFDLGGVLTTPILDSFVAWERKLGLPENLLLRIFAQTSPEGEPHYHALERGEMTEAEFYRRLGEHIVRELGSQVAWPSDPLEVRKGLWGGIKRNEPMIACVRDIAKHYKTALLTNNVREWGFWREYYPTDVFDAVVDSSDVGVRKPDPKIFHLTCERLGVDPAKCSFVDDIPANVEGARNLGMTAIVFTTTGEVIDRLRPLFPKAFVSQGAAILEE